MTWQLRQACCPTTVNRKTPTHRVPSRLAQSCGIDRRRAIPFSRPRRTKTRCTCTGRNHNSVRFEISTSISDGSPPFPVRTAPCTAHGTQHLRRTSTFPIPNRSLHRAPNSIANCDRRPSSPPLRTEPNLHQRTLPQATSSHDKRRCGYIRSRTTRPGEAAALHRHWSSAYQTCSIRHPPGTSS